MRGFPGGAGAGQDAGQSQGAGQNAGQAQAGKGGAATAEAVKFVVTVETLNKTTEAPLYVYEDAAAPAGDGVKNLKLEYRLGSGSGKKG